jgi:D-amino-acid dehydrogenase
MRSHDLSRDPSRDPDVLVIGGGVVGLFCAYHLRHAGCGVAVLERGPVGGPQSCSAGNTGFVGTHGATVPVLLDMKKHSLGILRELCASGPLAAAFAAPGMIIAYRAAEEFEQACRAVPALVARGIPLRVLDPGELSVLEPEMEFAVHGATYNEEGAYLRLPNFLCELATVLEAMGVEIHPDTEALDVEVLDRTVRQVRTTRGDFRPKEVVLAGGVWSPSLAGRLGVRLPLQPVKGHAVTVRGPAPRRPVTLGAGDSVLAIAPTSDGFRLGGVREHVGFDSAVSPHQVDAMLRTVREYLPRLGHAEPVGAWTGLRPTTPDDVPFIGRAPRYHNLSIACGHSHLGMGLAPAGGRLLAQLIAGERPDLDPAPFRVDRY